MKKILIVLALLVALACPTAAEEEGPQLPNQYHTFFVCLNPSCGLKWMEVHQGYTDLPHSLKFKRCDGPAMITTGGFVVPRITP